MSYRYILPTFTVYDPEDNIDIEYPEDVTEMAVQNMICVQMSSGGSERIVYSASAILIFTVVCIVVSTTYDMMCMIWHLQPQVLKDCTGILTG